MACLPAPWTFPFWAASDRNCKRNIQDGISWTSRWCSDQRLACDTSHTSPSLKCWHESHCHSISEQSVDFPSLCSCSPAGLSCPGWGLLLSPAHQHFGRPCWSCWGTSWGGPAPWWRRKLLCCPPAPPRHPPRIGVGATRRNLQPQRQKRSVWIGRSRAEDDGVSRD